MSVSVDMRFLNTRTSRLVAKDVGYVFKDWFRDPSAIGRAEAAATVPEARTILNDAYKGPDADGIAVVWVVTDNRG